MKTIQADCERLRRGIRRMAEVTVDVVDSVRGRLTPARLQNLQDGVRGELLATEVRMREMAARRRRRMRRLARRFAGREWWSRCIGTHSEALAERDVAWEWKRSLLRQVGDSPAWMVLREDPDILMPLFTHGTHHVPQGIGLAGQVQIEMAAHNTGEFLVLENDLTRALGVGDITVVSVDGAWQRPLSYELKSRGKFEVGANLEIDLITAVSEAGLDADLHRRFT